MAEQEVLYIIQRLALVLKYCHEIGIAHRDIKSDNILIDDCNNMMLIDFAFSNSSLSGKKVENYCGTPSYMAPELIQKQPHCPKKADVWALGVVTYKILTGKHPFAGKPIVIKQQKMNLNLILK